MVPLSVTDMHTGGEPVRIVTAGWPEVFGSTILEKRVFAREHHDHLRKILMFEPRGHYDMYGVLMVGPSIPGADLAVLFMHNEGWSTMCGHAVIAMARYAVDHGMVATREPVTRVGVECPCGLVVADVEVVGGKARAVSFESVPAFLAVGDLGVDVPGFGAIVCDVAYGGAFYALADCGQFGLAFGKSRVRDFVDAASALSEAVRNKYVLSHPDSRELEFLYGSILTDGGEGGHSPTRNICVFADAEVDRSPTGSGVTARVAAMHAKGTICLGETRIFESITGARFSGSVARVLAGSVTVRVGGRAFYSGKAEYVVEPDDPLGGGFLVR